MSEYVDSLLLSCNRKQSVEYLAGNSSNTATWTNVVSNGVKLNVGDQVSVHSSAISEIGNESATIEIKGKNLGGFYNCSHTTGGGEFTNSSEGYYKTSYQQTDLKFPMRDDTLNLTYSYYKTTNGEYYYHLPRKGCWDAKHHTWTADNGTNNVWCNGNASTNGSLSHPNPFRFNLDYRTKVRGQVFYSGGEMRNQDGAIVFTTAPMNDGGRYTLFVRDSSFNSSDNGSISGHRDPALFNYLWYKQTKQIQVDSGFNSPLNIADRITNNLAETTRIDSVSIGENFQNNEMENADIQVESETNKLFPCASGVNVEFNKGKNYHNYSNPTGASWDYDYEGGYLTIGVKRPEIYETGCRINVYNAGGNASSLGTRNDFNNLENDEFSSIDGSFTPFNIDFKDGIGYPIENSVNGSYTNIFPLHIPWRTDVLKKLGDFLKSQKRYPELFNYDNYTPEQKNYIDENSSGNISVDKCRFIHMNASHSRVAGSNAEYSGAVFFTNITSGSNVISVGTTPTLDGDFKVGDLLYLSVNGPDPVNLFPKDTYIVKITGTPGTFGATLTLNNSALVDTIGDTTLLYFTDRKLGNDNYTSSFSGSLNASQTAPAFFFDYNPDREGILDGEGDSYDTLYDGFAVKVDNTHNVKNGSGNMSHLIGLRFGTHIKTMSPYWWRTSGLPPSIGSRMKNVRTLSCGFDKHFNSFGNCFMNLYNGDACSWNQYYRSHDNSSGNKDKSLSQAPENFGVFLDRFTSLPRVGLVDGAAPPSYFASPTAWNNARPVGAYMRNQIYIGANDPVMLFSSGQSRFQLSRLHTPEYIGNLANADEGVSDAQAIVYKINKRLNNNNFTPEMMPYDQQDYFSSIRSGNAKDRDKPFSVLNLHLAPYGICDVMSGIQIEDYGVDEEHWNDSLWGLMGFSYSQFHQTTDNRLVRMFDKGLTTDTPTTNAQISANEVIGYPKNGSDVPNFDSLETFPVRWARTKPLHSNYNGTNLGGMMEFPTVVQNCSSTSITADSLPRKMLSPVFLIKSSLIDGSFIGGEESQMKMPVMSVVPKNSGYGDFYNGAGGEAFTITYPKTITEIKTSIVDADGTESRVDDGSLVVYKVTKVMKSNSSVVQDILFPQPPQK